MKKAYFQYYETFDVILEKIHDIEEREFIRNCIIRYGLYGEMPSNLEEHLDIAFTVCKEMIDDQVHRREVNAENRRQKLQAKDEVSEEEPKQTKRFTKPTVEEITAYCKERNNGINAEQFFNFYEAKGWKVGNSTMKDWKACVRTWEQRKTTTFGERTHNALPDDRQLL